MKKWSNRSSWLRCKIGPQRCGHGLTYDNSVKRGDRCIGIPLDLFRYQKLLTCGWAVMATQSEQVPIGKLSTFGQQSNAFVHQIECST